MKFAKSWKNGGIASKRPMRSHRSIARAVSVSCLAASSTGCGDPPGQTEPRVASRDLPEMIEEAVERGDREIRIPPGRYYVQPKNGTHIRLEGVENFTIDATGVEMVCSETTRAILIEDCENVAIRGLTIDYDPLPFTQGEIVEISEDRKSHVIRIQEGFPPAESAYVFKHLIFTPEGELRFGHYYRMEVEALADNRLRIHGLHPRKDGGERIGDIVVISSEALVGRYDPHAVHLYESDDTVLEDMTIYASPCFGFFEEHSSGSVYRNCVIDRREGRLLSLNADAFHSKFARTGPRIENCRAFWMGDDGINICGSYHLVTGSEGPTFRVLAKRSLDIEAGDPVQLLAADGSRLPPGKVVSVDRIGGRTEADAEKLKDLDLLPWVAALLDDAYEIRLEEPVDLEFGSVIGSLNRMGNGFSIRDSEFGNIRSRGILVKAGDGVIADNTVVNCHLQGIKISPEILWLESGTSRNLIVKGNEIIASKAESILVDTVGKATIHEDIDIVDNRIRSDSFPLIRIRGLNGGRLQGNELEDSEGRRAPGAAVSIEHSKNIVR